MRVNVLLFGPAAMAQGADSVAVLVEDGATCGRIMAAVADEFPALRPFTRKGRLAVNAAYADPEARIFGGDELALISMVSGG